MSARIPLEKLIPSAGLKKPTGMKSALGEYTHGLRVDTSVHGECAMTDMQCDYFLGLWMREADTDAAFTTLRLYRRPFVKTNPARFYEHLSDRGVKFSRAISKKPTWLFKMLLLDEIKLSDPILISIADAISNPEELLKEATDYAKSLDLHNSQLLYIIFIYLYFLILPSASLLKYMRDESNVDLIAEIFEPSSIEQYVSVLQYISLRLEDAATINKIAVPSSRLLIQIYSADVAATDIDVTVADIPVDLLDRVLLHLLLLKLNYSPSMRHIDLILKKLLQRHDDLSEFDDYLECVAIEKGITDKIEPVRDLLLRIRPRPDVVSMAPASRVALMPPFSPVVAPAVIVEPHVVGMTRAR